MIHKIGLGGFLVGLVALLTYCATGFQPLLDPWSFWVVWVFVSSALVLVGADI